MARRFSLLGGDRTLPSIFSPSPRQSARGPGESTGVTGGAGNTGDAPDPTPGPSRPTPHRSHTLQLPTSTSTPSTGPMLPLPVTAPVPTSRISPAPRRDRAHTVSVSVKRQPNDQVEDQKPLSTSDGRRVSVTSNNSLHGRRASRGSIRRRFSWTPASFDDGRTERDADDGQDLDDGVVGMLDCIDPQVSTVNHLQNMSNTLIFPHFPQLWSRRPEVVLPETPSDESRQPLTAPEGTTRTPSTTRRRATTITRPRSSTVSRMFPPTPNLDLSQPPTALTSTSTGTATVTGTFAPMPESSPPSSPDISRIESQELEDDVELIEKDHELDAHVRHVLRNQDKRSKLKRAGKGLWTFVKTPMGFITAVYGFLVAFWGAAIVLFLLGWIPTSSKYRKDVWVEISSQVENGLFTLTGVGLIPWRVIDTYRMFMIWRLKRLTTKRRADQGLTPIPDDNDIPDPVDHAEYVSVLSEDEQAQLKHQQEKFAKSQTWYKPHATATHTAFPISWALWNTVLMDGNSAFQCCLCGCMWGLNWHVRPPWTTGILIPLSFLCGIGAGVLIWRGTVRTKKSANVEKQLRLALNIPLAIGIPQTKDGTIITGDNRAHDGKVDEKSSEKNGSTGMDKTIPTSPRRTTVTFGNVMEATEKGRPRGSTVAAPGSQYGREKRGMNQNNGVISERDEENQIGDR